MQLPSGIVFSRMPSGLPKRVFATLMGSNPMTDQRNPDDISTEPKARLPATSLWNATWEVHYAHSSLPGQSGHARMDGECWRPRRGDSTTQFRPSPTQAHQGRM